MAERLRRLDDYPKLAKWYVANLDAPPLPSDPVRRFIWATCQTLTLEPFEAARRWSRAIQELLSSGIAMIDALERIEASFATGDVQFADVASEIAELALETDAADDVLTALERLAAETGSVAMRFLVAWLALNTNQLARCIEACEQVDEPYAAIHTIQGQALLESGAPRDAIEALRVATTLAPKEVLAWFQLAKAHFVLDEAREAWDSLEQCATLAPQNAEVALFMAMTALSEKPADPAKVDASWRALSAHLEEHAANLQVVTHLLDLAFLSQSEERACWIVEVADWQALYQTAAFVPQVGRILKKLEVLRWPQVTSNFLTKMSKGEGAG